MGGELTVAGPLHAGGDMSVADTLDAARFARIGDGAVGGSLRVASPLLVSGNAVVGAGGNASLLVQHVDGNSHLGDAQDGLFLNRGPFLEPNRTGDGAPRGWPSVSSPRSAWYAEPRSRFTACPAVGARAGVRVLRAMADATSCVRSVRSQQGRPSSGSSRVRSRLLLFRACVVVGATLVSVSSTSMAAAAVSAPSIPVLPATAGVLSPLAVQEQPTE